ncbi:MAG: hypothetical protein CO030_04030 [Candidatus Magasanikbacteria bacterium CG_4_9_14_0_2_um_filter_42_11]|uniref:Methyltransferase type 11 domain-containing protein n=1 Tax=Candidatus Magasanikbacteria bacterium CG_4_9_14_0_2_um_filter_42_11 TaxID=1974643 RepID=A0A2M8F959_9BACT|nr:MAG: hypothetical protein COU34_04245 [Candidatus Magasanikbacteria bacterium CG10_big_fil_rev_8_21_14_0_10_43_9]PIY92237.1 MAG: hypothetical protein COY70_04270 [Candidatus Magasanikbacteria bacterium CG_4_10_14_0_8_um_filter_42_12]PJC52260.1 MAG: hypothetical protein CO030_04030 [Candidatus Magasanikbacteria bacterium CG_4_9_14_0_2_um_filter_42_11]
MEHTHSDEEPYAPVAHTHGQHRRYAFISRLLFGHIQSRIAKNIASTHPKTVLDIGCGPGFLLKKLHAYKGISTLYGVDPDPSMVRYAQSLLKNISSTIFCANAVSLPLEDATCDAVVTSLAFHHLSSEQKIRATKEIVRVLQPGKRFWIFDFVAPTNFLGRLLIPLSPEHRMLQDNMSGRVREILTEGGLMYEKTHWKVFGGIALVSYRRV